MPGWRVSTDDGLLSIQQTFRFKDASAAEEALARLAAVATSAGHAIFSSKLDVDCLTLALHTPGKQTVTLNDFILAGKLNAVDVKDLQVAKKRPLWV